MGPVKPWQPCAWGVSNRTRYVDYVDGLARRVERVDDVGNVNVLLIQSVSPLPADAQATCGQRPKIESKNEWIDSDAPAALEVRKARSGHLLVRPRFDGEEVGWLMFDTGAPVTTISPTKAAQLGLEEVGVTQLGGAGSKISSVRLLRAAGLELGPLVLENPLLTEFDTLGREPVGIIGWDALIHTVVEIDMLKGSIAIYARNDYELPAGEWRAMTLHLRHPAVWGTFAGGDEGLFRIDTGAGSLGVMFHSPTVQKFDLLSDRKTEPFQASGAGGRLNLRSGTLDWFELAGHRTENSQALFCMDESGALADANLYGNLGGGVLKPFILAFDYQGKRVGFVPRKELAK